MNESEAHENSEPIDRSSLKEIISLVLICMVGLATGMAVLLYAEQVLMWVSVSIATWINAQSYQMLIGIGLGSLMATVLIIAGFMGSKGR